MINSKIFLINFARDVTTLIWEPLPQASDDSSNNNQTAASVTVLLETWRHSVETNFSLST